MSTRDNCINCVRRALDVLTVDVGACLVLASPGITAIANARIAEFTLQSNIDLQLNMFVDDKYACGRVMMGGGNQHSPSHRGRDSTSLRQQLE